MDHRGHPMAGDSSVLQPHIPYKHGNRLYMAVSRGETGRGTREDILYCGRNCLVIPAALASFKCEESERGDKRLAVSLRLSALATPAGTRDAYVGGEDE
jgi:hypothetical protein